MNHQAKIPAPAIGGSEKEPPIPNLGDKPNMAWLPKKSLQVDKRYQRELKSAASAKLIALLQEKFCWAHCAPLIVTDNADGTYNIVDGQHRWKAAIGIAQITLLPCMVHEEMDLREQANAFVAHNAARVKVGPLAIFHARGVSGDPVAIGVLNACKVAGVVIPRGHRRAIECKPNETAAIGVLQEIYRSFDPDVAREVLADTLRTIMAAYPDKPGQLSSFMIRAVRRALEDNARAHVIAALRGTCDADLQLEARFAVSETPEAPTIREAYYTAFLAHVAKVAT